jgi:hypothetical protein
MDIPIRSHLALKYTQQWKEMGVYRQEAFKKTNLTHG